MKKIATFLVPLFISQIAHADISGGGLTDYLGNGISSQSSGSQRPLDVGVNVSGVQVDPRSIRALTSGTDSIACTQSTVPWADNITQFGGTNLSTGTGTGGAGIPRVTVSSDSSLTCNAGTNLNTSTLATSANQTNASQKTQVVDGSGNVQPSGDVLTRKIFVQPTDGTNNQGYTASNEAKVSVTQPIPTGTNSIGQVTANAGTNLNTSLLALQSGANSFLDRNTSSSLGALNAALTWTGNGLGAGLFTVAGTFVGTILAEGTVDGITWNALSLAIGSGVSSSTGVSTIGTYRILSNSAFTQVRLRMSAYTSGSATVTFNGSAARSEQTLTMLDKAGSGTITALNGVVTAATNGTSTVVFNILGTWVATLVFEGQDGNGNWVATIGTVPGNGSPTASTGVNLAIAIPSGGFNQVRVRASAFVSGTVNITYNSGEGLQTLQVFNLTPSALLTTASQGGAWTVQANAGTNLNTSALALSATQTNGTQKTQVVDASGNVQSSGDVAARKIFVANTDGTNTQTVKAASTAAASTDPGAVVVLSSNFPVLTGTTGTAVSVGTASTSTVASNANRAGLILVNTSTARISCTVGTAVLNSGVSLFPGGTWTMDQYTFTTAAIACIAGAAASNISVQEFTK